MADRTEYRRQSNRGRRKQSEPSDAIVVALTVQVIVCILLLLVAVLARKVDENRFEQVRRQYDLMVADPAEGAEVLDELADVGGGFQRFFTSVENLVATLIQRFAGAPEPPAAEPPAPPEGDAGGTEEARAFDYNYLGPGEVSYTLVSQDVRPTEMDLTPPAGNKDGIGYTLGQGGRFPVNTGGKEYAKLSAPEGATFAAVELSCDIVPPVTGSVTSEFSYREHPLDGEDDFHTGIDIAAVEGREILSALPGRVAEVGESATYGKYIVLHHSANLQTFYAHCSEIIASEGMAVRQGERIAKVGSTGVATGPHLHFSVIVEGQFTDPYWVLKNNIRLVG